MLKIDLCTMKRSFLSGFDLLSVELQFSAFQNVSVSSAWLTRSRTDTGQQSLLSKLFGNLWINDSVLLSFVNSILSSLWSLLLINLCLFTLLGHQVDAIMVQIPLTEWGCINLNNTVLDQCLGSNEFVIRSVIDNIKDSCFSGGWLWSPVEVTFLESECSELIISTSDSDSSDSGLVVDKFGVWYWSGFFESSLLFMNWHSTAS